ncbi:hypothetical protein ZHAS_00007149 [Anopheles sinensis]|uniref:Dynein heavy chain tail domain-containing protein n=1 Tax=Anopheles sinensis TaxID=74873 RepID=A0A084VP90_ANOSI|nr:hypothetical protein ZHAS_00007149 [Anopheles sinensis]
MASVHPEGDLSEISSLTDSSDEGKKVVEEVIETVEEADKPAYSEEDLETLVGFIRGMIILFDYDDEDFNEEAAEVIKLWLTDANNPLLFIFYDGNRLTASLAFPLCPINDLMYFMREEEQLFSALERFHDDILFGTLHGDIEGSLLVLLEQVYGPMILANVDWSENVKANVINGFNAFMTYLTELHYKLSGFTLLYVPREGSDMEVQEVVLNRSMIKRLEAVVIDWTGQIRATLADTQHFVPDDLVCPSDEYSFWLYRHEVLSAIRLQYKGPNVQHIVRILELAQSLYIKHLKDVLADLDRGIEIAESNIPFLKLLVDPCFAIGTLETADDFCSQLIYVMHIIRFIGTDSSHLNRDESITKLFLYLSNEIVACCMRGIDVGRILAGAPRYGIEVCRMKINCCESYKIIYEEMLEHFKEEFPWNLDYAAIFNRINAFLQRLNDILEICDAMLIFGKYAESTAYTSYRFFCNGAEEFERRCDQVEKIFHGALETIESVGGTILDINNKDWYRHIGEFREMLKSLDDIIENLLSNVFMMSENLEEKLNVLVTLLNFYQRENIRESFMRKIGEVWGIFNEEIMQLSKDISAGISQYPALLPPHAGRYAVLKMRFDHLKHHRKLIVDCRFFPDYPQQEEVLALFEACEKQVKAALKGLSDSWSKSITSDMASWYQRNLICRSNLRPGLFEVNIERRLLVLFDEAHYFKTLGVSLPMSLDLEKHENTRLTFDNVLRLVLYFNGVVSSISDKERLFFKPMIQQTERKLEPMRSKLTWEEDLTEFIEGYVVNVRELLDLIELYKRENHKIAALVERMYGMVFVRLEQPHAVSMAQLMASVAEQKKAVFTEFLEVFTEISQNIFTIYDSLGSNVRKMAASWEQYLHKIDKLLKAAIFTCTLNTLRGVRTALENTHSNPILLIEILLKKDGAVYEPSVDAVEQTLRRLVEEVCLTIRPVPSMSKRYQLESEERSFYLQLLEHPDYIAISGTIGETIDDTVRLLRTYQAKWNVFRPFWCVDKSAFIERFRLSAMTSDAFQKNIEKFEELQNQLSTQSDCIVCRSVEIDALKLKYALTSHIGEWQTKYIDYLKCVAYGKIIDFNNVLKRNVEELRHEPKEVHELKRLEERYQACFEELPVKEQEIAVILKFFVVLEKYVVDLLPEAYELRHNIGSIWAQYLADMKEIREQIDNYQDQFKLSMTGAADALKVDALEMLKMLREEMQTSDDSSPGEAFEAIDRLMMQLEVLERREQEIAERMLLLGVSYVPLPALREIRCTLENLRLVWLLVDEWRSMEARVMSENYRTVDELELQSTSSYFREAYEKISQRLLENDSFEVFDRLGKDISQFSVTVTIVCGMRSSFLQDRHWERVRQIAECGASDELSANSSLLVISKMGIYRHERELMALCKFARMEHEVELDLEGIAGRVRAIELNIRIPPTVDGFPELLNSRRCFETLEDSIGIINRLRSSPHRLPFQPLVDYWEHTMGILQEILEVLTQMQTECRTLFELYRASDVGGGLSAEMDDFREGFRSCFAQWCELMRHLSSARLVEDICALESIRKRINQQADGLRVVLEKRRHSFPRFHLLSDRQLIALMSRPTSHSRLEASLAVLFENVSRFHLGSQGDTICGVYTCDEEYIPFGAPLPPARPKTPAPIDETMNQVERGIRDALQDLLCKCHAALRGGYFRRVESGWLRSWPLQLCLKSAELQHTLHTRNALVQCSLLGTKKPLKMLRSLHAKLLEELTASSRSETTDRWQRKKLYDLLIVELNARDLIGRLSRRPELHGLESFEWVSQLHSHLHPTSQRCTVQLLDVRFSYGYECKRSTEPMLLTPASEKARLATMCAIRAGQLPTLLGTSGANCGRRVLLQSLAQSVGVFLLTLDLVVECVGPLETMTPSAVSRFTLLHIAPGDLRWEDAIEGWLGQKQREPFERECVRELTGKYFGNMLSLRRRQCQSVVTVTDVTMARTFCHLWDALFASLGVDQGEHFPTETLPEPVVKLFFFCTVWSIGGSLDDEDSRARFDLLLREQHPEAGYPLKANVFQLPHTVAYEYLTLALMKTGGTVLLASVAAPTGKTALIEAALRSLDPTQWYSMRIALTQRTSPWQLRSRLRCHAMKIMKDRLYPEDRKRLACFVDDLHSSQSNPYAVDEFVRGLIERVEWYEGEGATRVHLEQCQMVAAMRLQSCGAGFSPVVQSLVNKCHLLVMTSIPDSELGTIFASMIRSAVGEATELKSSVVELLGPASVDFVGRLARHLPPTPGRLRYQFSLRTIAAIVRSLCVCLRAGGVVGGWQEKGPLLRLWVHECFRETWDQLERVDRGRFYELLNETLSGHFEATLHGLCPSNQSPLFTDILGKGRTGQNPYEDVPKVERLM